MANELDMCVLGGHRSMARRADAKSGSSYREPILKPSIKRKT